MATSAEWVEALRIRTLPAATAPVLAGSGIAQLMGGFNLKIMAICLAIALLMQIGVNLSNDYSDGIRGIDSKQRIGPQRLVGSGAARPKIVLVAALFCYLLACAGGVWMTVITEHWWYLAIGAACVLGAWFYTGGKHPYGYAGLGEVFVFIFFGLVAVGGTTHAQTGRLDIATWLAAAGIGCLACAILVCNNLRDIRSDRLSGKRTLEVRIGDRNSRLLFVMLLLSALGALVALALHATWWVLLGLVSVLFMAGPLRLVWRGATGLYLVQALKLTGIAELIYGLGILLGCFLA